MTEPLKPCPFCGERDLKMHITDFIGCYIRCQTCTMTGPNGCDQGSATIQWNTRTEKKNE